MIRKHLAVSILSVLSPMICASLACGQDYPTKPIRIITGAAGGGSDLTSRQIAQGISGALAQPVIVDNRANGVLAGEAGAKGLPDGYTLHVNGAILWTTPLLRKVSYDVLRDFSPISLLVREVLVVTVHPSVPAKSVKELIAVAKARPGELNYGSASGVGSTSYLAVELFKSMAGVNIVHVPYKGGAANITALISGEVQLTITDVGLVGPHVKSAALRALAVTSADPSALAPGLPTVAAAGLPGYEAIGSTAVFAPAQTSPAIIDRLNREILRYLNRGDVKEKFLTSGSEVVGSSPQELGAKVRSEIGRMAKLIKDAGIKVE